MDDGYIHCQPWRNDAKILTVKKNRKIEKEKLWTAAQRVHISSDRDGLGAESMRVDGVGKVDSVSSALDPHGFCVRMCVGVGVVIPRSARGSCGAACWDRRGALGVCSRLHWTGDHTCGGVRELRRQRGHITGRGVTKRA